MSARSPHFVRGVICTLLGASLWGFSGTCFQLLISQYHMSVPFMTCMRMLGAGVLFLVIILIRERPAMFAALKDWKTLGQLAIYGVFGLFLCQFCYMMTIDYTNAGTATILQCLGIVLVMIFTCIVGRRFPHFNETIGLVLALGATFILATHGNPLTIAMPLAGLAWGIATGFSSAFYSTYAKSLLEHHSALIVTGLSTLIGGILITLAIRPWTIPVTFQLGSVAALIATIVFGSFGAFYLYIQGVSDIGPMRAILLGAAEPVSAIIISWLWLGTLFPPIDVLGFAMMIAMVFFVTREKKVGATPASP